MDPISLALGGGSILSSLFGLFGGDNRAKEYTDKAIQELIKVNIPDPAQQRLALEHYQSAGELTPELEHAIQQNPSAFEQVVNNTKYSAAQDRALGQLQDIGDKGGLNLSDKANLQDQLIQSSNKDKASRDAISDEMARRGQLGSGMALQAQLGGEQSAGDRDAQARLHALGGAQDRALQAIQGAGDLAGKLQGQDYQRQSDLASARDRINQFNTTNAQSVQQRNVSSNNAAAEENLQNKQRLLNSNTDLGNKEQQYNKELIQKNYENQMQKSKAVADAYTGAAQQATGQQAQQRQAFGAVGSGLGQLGTSIQQQNNWDKWFNKAKQ